MELITPPLDGMVLPGVTRDSVLSLARNHVSGNQKVPGLPSNLVVNERQITMNEVKIAAQNGQLVELFGAGMLPHIDYIYIGLNSSRTGTAAVICPIDRIGYMGNDVIIPTGPEGMGPISKAIWDRLIGIQYGKVDSSWSVSVCNV